MLRLHGWQPERSRMVKIIEQKDDAQGAPYLEFHVRQEGIPPRVLGHYIFARSGPGTEHMAITGNSDAEVQGAWIQATSWAQQLGVEFILVIDPDGLFPSGKRV